MKILLATSTALLMTTTAVAQESAPMSLASTMEVYVFPTEGQDAGQQSMDEASCYDYAATNTGNDPFNLAKEAEADAQLAEAEMDAAESTGQGSGARTALRGAAAGALIAEVSKGDTSEGAAIGAAAGAVRVCVRHCRQTGASSSVGCHCPRGRSSDLK